MPDPSWIAALTPAWSEDHGEEVVWEVPSSQGVGRGGDDEVPPCD